MMNSPTMSCQIPDTFFFIFLALRLLMSSGCEKPCLFCMSAGGLLLTNPLTGAAFNID